MSDLTQAIVMNDCAVMNQHADSPTQAQSPLVNIDWAGPVSSTARTGVEATELALMGHIILRGKPDDQAFKDGAAQVLGAPLPGCLQSITIGAYVVRWLSPDSWLITLAGDQAFALETALRETLTGHYQVVNVSGGQTIVMLSGAHVEDVLMKSVHYDVHPSNFPVGKVVNTNFAKTGCTLRKVAEQQWELIIRRSFADYIAAWIQDAASEYGFSFS